MENNALLNEQIFGANQLLKLTALVYFKEALIGQQYETCSELINAAKKAGAVQEEISEIINDYLNSGSLEKTRRNRIR